ncbi:outer membrane beta-barrel protein, partial [Helicobacter heilmannii]|uniref:outer membrane beta-barrel protein n=1 Tax=Helicobacter heilmannii TaxID=35817 RepID=UPI000A3E27C5
MANQSSYNAAYNTALGKLLGYAMSYNKNSTALGGMLSSSSLLSNVLNQGINNAAANVMFNAGATEATSAADALNGQANTLNNLKAIFNSEDLLNEYVGAITQNYSRSPANVQQSQASALSYLYNALNASAAQDGLIAQTKEAIANALNNNFLASNLPASALQTIDAMGPKMFEPAVTKAQIAVGLTNLNSVLSNFTTTRDASAIASLTTDTLSAVFSNIQTAQTIAKEVAMINNMTAGTSFNLASVLTSILGTSKQDINTAISTTLDSAPAGVKNAVVEFLGYLTGATATAAATSLSGQIGTLVGALNAGVAGQAVAFGTATSFQINGLLGTVANIESSMKTVEAGLNISQFTAASAATQVLGYLKELPTLAQEIGMATGVSARQSFLDGTLSATDLSQQIQALKAQIASYENMGTNSTGQAGLGIGLSSMLGSSISSVQNLGFADAAVNTLKTQLGNALPLLVNGTGANSSSFNIATVQGLVADLNKAVGTLYSGTNGNLLFNNGDVQTTSNMNNYSTTVSPNTFGLGGGGGVTANTQGGNELTNLNNLNTINSLLSGGILTSNAISTSYNGAFGSGTGSNVGFAGNIATTANLGSGSSQTAYAVLTGNYNAGTTLTSVINALLPIGQQLASGTISTATAKADAITALTPLISTPSTNAQYVWAAYESVMGLNSGGTNSVSGLNNLLASKQNLSTASGIAQVLTDANSLVNANNALVPNVGGLSSGAKVLSVGSGANVINTATNLNNAIAAATALGNLLKQINPADLTNPVSGTSTAVTSATTVINAINSYNHNVALLNNLTDGKGASIAGDVIAYLQGNSAYNTLTGKSVGTTAINNLQNLLNRYEYLQGLQAKVNAAIENNPYALVMQSNQVLKSNGYQAAAKALVSTTGNDTGLFNVATSSTLSPGASTTLDLNNTAFTNLSATVSNDITNAQTWNAYFTNLNTSNSILSAPALGTGTQAIADLNNIAHSIYNLAGYFSPVGVSDNKVVTTNLSSAVNGALGAYNAISTALSQLNSTSAPNLNLASGVTTLGLSNLTTAGTGNGMNTAAATGSSADTITFLQVAQSIVDVSNMLTPASGQTNGIVNNQSAISAVTTVMGNTTGSSTTIQGTDGQLAGVFTGMTNPIPNSVTGINGTAVNTQGTNGAATGVAPNASALNTVNDVSVAVVGGIVKAIESNATLAGFLADPSSFSAGTDNANVTALENAIQPFVGGDVSTSSGNVSTSSGNITQVDNVDKAKIFLTALNKLVGPGGALQSLNSQFKAGVRAAVANFNSPNFVANVDKMLNNALDWSTNYANALRAVKSDGTLGTASSGAIASAATYNAIASIVQNADTLFNSTAASGGSNSGALATATQALAQFALDNSISSSTPDVAPIPTTAAGAANLSQLMAYYLGQDMGLSASTLSDLNVASLVSQATPAQLAAAATQVLASSQFKDSTAMQQNLLNTTLGNMLSQAQTYTNAATGGVDNKAGLSGLLNGKTTIADVLQTAIANAASMHNLKSMLNPANTDGVSVSNGQLSSTSINTINKLLTAMKTENGSLPTINTNTPVGAEAQMLIGMLAANNAATSALSALSATGGATNNTAQAYFQNVTTLINDQATLLSRQTSTVMQLLTGMTQAVADSTTTDAQAQNAFGALKAVYTQIASPTINYDSAMHNLVGVINQLQSLQEALINQLAANQGQPGVSGASVSGLGTLQAAVLAAEAEKGFSGTGATGQMSAPQIAAATSLLNKIQTALAYAKAAQLKMSQMLASHGIMTAYSGSRMPMQTMNSNGNMYGIDVQFGYKQFFGKKKRWGLRYYANFSYQHGTFMVSDAAELDNFVYG